MRKIIVGSRRSKLALTQTNWVIEQLKKLDDSFEFEVKEIVTKGDKILDVTLSKVGGKGLFVKEIEQAMLDKEIDMAVHSMKDMPAVLPEGLVIGCIPGREDHRDAFISKNHIKFSELKPGCNCRNKFACVEGHSFLLNDLISKLSGYEEILIQD